MRAGGKSVPSRARTVFILGLVFLAPLCAEAVQHGPNDRVCAGEHCFPKAVQVGEQVLPARGAGTKTFLFLKPYDAAFYVAPDVPAEAVLGPVAKKLVIRYRKDLDRETLIEAAEHNLRRNPGIDLESLRARIDQMHGLYQDVREGDEYSLVFIPGAGTELRFNGEFKGLIPGEDFQAAYFGVWLSDHVFCERMRKKLLSI